MSGLKHFFTCITNPRQRQYEAIRAIEVDGLSVAEAAKKFNYQASTIYSLIRDLKVGKIELFPRITERVNQAQTPGYIADQVYKLRKQNRSAKDIAEIISREGFKIAVRTVERVLEKAGFAKLKRRTQAERGLTCKAQQLPERASAIDFEKLKPFTVDLPVAGVFFFIPYIIEADVLDIVSECQLPGSSAINSLQANLAMLLLKLIGNSRLSHINNYNHEPGLALFAGLTMLPKSSYMTSYSCRTSQELLVSFQKQIVTHFQEIYPDFYQSDYINLDFHSIPHYGTESQMEKVWVGAKHQAMKGAHTLFAQDSRSNVILYTKADVLRANETKEIMHFVEYWKSVKKQSVQETLVFDCKLTNYDVLDDLNRNEDVKFITLRKRSKKLLGFAAGVPEEEWKKFYIPIPKRKNKHCKIYESEVVLKKNCLPLRQIIIKDHGRTEPTFIITNNTCLPTKEVLIIYAKRWHIESKLAELVAFFNLNALSSPLMIRIHFDLLWTVIADTLYHRFSRDLPRFEHERANTLFNRFIDMPGKISYTGNEFIVKIRKRAHTPILKGITTLENGVNVPWLNGAKLRIEWTA
jgi:transposase